MSVGLSVHPSVFKKVSKQNPIDFGCSPKARYSDQNWCRNSHVRVQWSV